MARILVVDDEESIVHMLSGLLESQGYEVTTALGGEVARDMLGVESFDLMISDIRMSPMSGMDLLKLAHDAYPTMSVIMLTAYGQVETAIESLQLGAFDYVKKPFKTEELLGTVERALQAHDYMEMS
jgi:DNA-binding NtrC family response regulator